MAENRQLAATPLRLGDGADGHCPLALTRLWGEPLRIEVQVVVIENLFPRIALPLRD